jgi:hypothetical protein
MHIALISVEVNRSMCDQGISTPFVNRSDAECFTVCGVGAFEHFCNANMDDVRLNVQVQLPKPTPQCYDIYRQPISREQWQSYQRTPQYRRIGLWQNENATEHVSTVWTGVDDSGCQPPHIFETMLVRFHDGTPRIENVFKSTCLADAREAHRQVIELVREGRL